MDFVSCILEFAVDAWQQGSTSLTKEEGGVLDDCNPRQFSNDVINACHEHSGPWVSLCKSLSPCREGLARGARDIDVHRVRVPPSSNCRRIEVTWLVVVSNELPDVVVNVRGNDRYNLSGGGSGRRHCRCIHSCTITANVQSVVLV